MDLFDSEPHTDPTDPTGFSLWVGNLTETVGLFGSEPHTDLTDPTGFLCGWEISRISGSEDKGMFFYFIIYY